MMLIWWDTILPMILAEDRDIKDTWLYLHGVYRNTALLADNSKEARWYRKHIGKRIATDSTYWTISSHSTERCKKTPGAGAGHGIRSFKSITQEAEAEANGSLWAWDCSTYGAPSQPGLCSQTLSQLKKTKLKSREILSSHLMWLFIITSNLASTFKLLSVHLNTVYSRRVQKGTVILELCVKGLHQAKAMTSHRILHWQQALRSAKGSTQLGLWSSSILNQTLTQ